MKKDWIYVLLSAGAVAVGVAGYVLFKKQSGDMFPKKVIQDSEENSFSPHTSEREDRSDRREILRKHAAVQTAPATEHTLQETSVTPYDASESDAIIPIDCVQTSEKLTPVQNATASIEHIPTDRTTQEKTTSRDLDEVGEKDI